MRSTGVVLSLTALLLVTACRAPQPDGSASASGEGSAPNVAVRTTLPDAPTVGPAAIEVFVLDGDEGVADAEVEIIGDMTHAGMEPVVADAPMADPGHYRTDAFRFTMAGDWILTTTVTLPDGTRVRDEVAATVAAP